MSTKPTSTFQRPPVLDLVAADKEIVVLRTFSKIYGHGRITLRLCHCSPDLLAKLDPYGWNSCLSPVVAAKDQLEEQDLVAERKKIMRTSNDVFFLARGKQVILSFLPKLTVS